MLSPYRSPGRVVATVIVDPPIRAVAFVVVVILVMVGIFAALLPAPTPCLATVPWDSMCTPG
jgi:hypothetical protein